MTQSKELESRIAELVAENRKLRAEVGRLGIGCRHLLACIDYLF